MVRASLAPRSLYAVSDDPRFFYPKTQLAAPKERVDRFAGYGRPMSRLRISVAERADAPALARFAAHQPLVWADFASIALLQPDEPRVWLAWNGDTVEAAAIDDGLAMSVGGTAGGLHAIADHVADQLDAKLVVAGRTDDVRTFVSRASVERIERPEHFMAVARADLRFAPEPIPLRIASAEDLTMLVRVRAAALAEEYDIDVPAGSTLYDDIAESLERAVRLQGVAIWVEEGGCAFTAQLIAKTPDAAMFGDLYTDPELRGAGRATRALTAFCGWLMSESAHVTLRVGVANTPAVRLYERVGFRPIEDFCSSLGPRPELGIGS
ncbi:MAG: family N-acetyltransferase [Thermoleophilia bacterium]|nr:family N-acetyltransferase [Thermoleophilia bacterium]